VLGAVLFSVLLVVHCQSTEWHMAAGSVRVAVGTRKGGVGGNISRRGFVVFSTLFDIGWLSVTADIISVVEVTKY
jgi:hypothetical protein